MRPQERSNFDQSIESLEERLCALPAPPVPARLEARLLAAIPAAASNESPRSALTPRPWHIGWSVAGLATVIAAASICAVFLWPRPDRQATGPSAMVSSPPGQPVHETAPQQPDNPPRVASWLESRGLRDGAERPLFAWPVQESSPLMVLAATRPDLLD
jgi:hypothetical protein